MSDELTKLKSEYDVLKNRVFYECLDMLYPINELTDMILRLSALKDQIEKIENNNTQSL